jgi:hypothetical protein
MKRWLKYFFISIGVVLFLFITAALVISQLYSDKIKDLLLTQLNNELQVKVEIKGAVKFVFWKNFPEATLEINHLVAHGSAPHPARKMLRANRVYLNMSIYDLLQQNWSFNSIVIEKGTFDLYKDKQGNINFKLLKETSGKKEPQEVELNIEKALLQKVHIIYHDETTDFITNVIIKNAVLKGDFKKETLFFNAEIDSEVKELSLKNETYLANKNVSLKGSLKIDTDKGHYKLATDYVTIENNVFKVNGLIAIEQQGTVLGIEIVSSEVAVKDVINLAPKNIADKLNEYNLTGNVEAKVKIDGMLSTDINPSINAIIKLKKSSFSVKELNTKAENVWANIQYNNGALKSNITSTLTIENITGNIGGSVMAGRVIIKNFEDPNLHIEYKGKLDLGLLQPFIINENVTAVKGLLHVDNLLLKVNLNRIQQLNNAEDLMIQSVFVAEEVYMKINNDDIFISKGNFNLNYKEIDIHQAQLSALKTNINLNLKLENWKQFLFALNKPEVSPINQLMITANIAADKMNWNQWQNYFNGDTTIKATGAAQSSTFNRNQAGNLGGKAKIKIDDFTFGKFSAKNVSTQLSFTPNQIFLQNGTLDALSGDADIRGYFAFKDRRLEINFSLVTRNADMKQLFSSFDNFEQTAITHENLDGKLTADLKFSSVWNKGVFDPASLYVYADMKIDNGKLVNFKPLESLSKFISIDELRNIRFGTLKNTIEIKNQTISIPKMLINSSVLNISVSGTQTFSGNIDYAIKLNLFDVLGKKFGRNKQQFEFEEIDEGNFNLFLNIGGTIDNPIVKYDKSGMKDKWKQQKEEFINFKTGTQTPYTKAKETKDWETKEELQEIDWD